VLAESEIFKPLASVKDRIGVAMIEDAAKAGKIDKDTVMVEPKAATPASRWPSSAPPKGTS